MGVGIGGHTPLNPSFLTSCLGACAIIPTPNLREAPCFCSVGYESSHQGPYHASVVLVLGPELS